MPLVPAPQTERATNKARATSASGHKRKLQPVCVMSALPPIMDIRGANGMSALGQEWTSLWKQLVRKTLHPTGHGYLDGCEIAPRRAWFGRDHLDPDNKDGRDHNEGSGQRLAPLALSGHSNNTN